MPACDETEMMDPHPSYHLTITSHEAEHWLRKSGNHCYLTRYSQGNKCYVLTVYQKEPYQMKHYPVRFNQQGQRKKYHIEGKEKEFDSLEDMLHHYENNPIDHGFMSIGRQVTKKEWDHQLSLDQNRCPDQQLESDQLRSRSPDQQLGSDQLRGPDQRAGPNPQEEPAKRKHCIIL